MDDADAKAPAASETGADASAADMPAKASKGAPAASQEAPAEPTKADRFATIIRNGLNNSAVSQDPRSWDALNTRLPEIVQALLGEP